MKKTIPAVSIIIPMFNTEKYVGECLDSILAQTFQDYEVIIVDDCSTDNSCDVVESYMPKFGGKLKMTHTKVNSGGCAVPKNVGIRFARGEYLMFVDSDDAITETALEELYSTAKKFDADVVHCEKCYEVYEEKILADKSILKERIHKHAEFVSAPTPMTRKLDERFNEIIAQKFDWSTYANFVRRDLILKHKIKFAEVKIGDDIFFTVQLLTLAEKIIKVPTIFYMYRMREGSLCSWGREIPIETRIKKWTGSSMRLIEMVDNFCNEQSFFQQNPNYRYALLNLMKESFSTSPALCVQIPIDYLDSLIRRELAEVKDKTALTAYLFARMNIFNLQLNQAVNLLNQQPKEVQDFQRNQMQLQQQQAIIQQQAAQIKQLQQQLENVNKIFH